MPRASVHGISGNPLFPAAVQLRKSDEVRSVGSRDTVIKLAWARVYGGLGQYLQSRKLEAVPRPPPLEPFFNQSSFTLHSFV
ncbi:uncharacterized protein LAJ45_07605 [Morchella importuna]|uniref:uncharacterized protein n=1 Tax=Morchella importuna TaxID=1174673 RepID=UPI001E8D62D3|nr:uncharacterized protein LAJ45_07605 [Morchella importuna]KAH8148502.1 hypothetical protein LAJ45_07605 [Morchella importuna]